ncbi:pro-neuregulin-1 membrane-bound isoform-like [Crotalus adamanteus]|uniref:Pro-neuregulin-1 membrane-bound isoform-like n=1 Tax=Crotalus adamanteus TaxID=8729 RepID=A0AAW1C1S8_CROAD
MSSFPVTKGCLSLRYRDPSSFCPLVCCQSDKHRHYTPGSGKNAASVSLSPPRLVIPRRCSAPPAHIPTPSCPGGLLRLLPSPARGVRACEGARGGRTPPPDTHTFPGKGVGGERGRTWQKFPAPKFSLARAKAAADGARRTEGEQRALKAAVRRAEGGKKRTAEREKEETKLFAPAVPHARSLVFAWTAVGRRDVRGEGRLRGAPTLDMNDSRRAATQEQGAAGVASSSSSSSPLEGPEKRRKNRKGKGGAGKKGAPREENGPAVPPKLKEMKSQESAVGQTLVLRCEASSEHLSLKFKWLKNGQEITKRNRPENIKIKSPKKQKTFSELRITKASLDDAGEYTCKASNRFGDDTTKAQITVTDTSEPTGMIPVLTKGVNSSSRKSS